MNSTALKYVPKVAFIELYFLKTVVVIQFRRLSFFLRGFSLSRGIRDTRTYIDYYSAVVLNGDQWVMRNAYSAGRFNYMFP